MHPTLELLDKELVQLAAQVTASVPSNEPFNVAHGNWSFPGVTRDELIQMTLDLSQLIEQRGGDSLSRNEVLLADYVRRLVYLRGNTVPQLWGGNSAAATSAYSITLERLKSALEAAFEDSASTTFESQKIEAVKTLNRVQKTLRAIEARISNIDSRSDNLDEKVERIEQAHEAADQLPTDLESLKELRTELERMLGASTKDSAAISGKLSEIINIRDQLETSEKEAASILSRCDEAYRATTSEGLASAFSERSMKLNNSMWIWVLGLICALSLGAVAGTNQLHLLGEAIKSASTQGLQQNGGVWIDLLLSLLSVGAPVWFAWISTKQIGQRFRLAEDYGYKAAISKAYEGYRREAAMLDPAFQARLFATALTRLDEIPLRLVETETHGSPWHEFASSDLVRQAIATVPGFADKITDFAKQAIPNFTQSNKTVSPKKAASTEE